MKSLKFSVLGQGKIEFDQVKVREFCFWLSGHPLKQSKFCPSRVPWFEKGDKYLYVRLVSLGCLFINLKSCWEWFPFNLALKQTPPTTTEQTKKKKKKKHAWLYTICNDKKNRVDVINFLCWIIFTTSNSRPLPLRKFLFKRTLDKDRNIYHNSYPIWILVFHLCF